MVLRSSLRFDRFDRFTTPRDAHLE